MALEKNLIDKEREAQLVDAFCDVFVVFCCLSMLVCALASRAAHPHMGPDGKQEG